MIRILLSLQSQTAIIGRLSPNIAAGGRWIVMRLKEIGQRLNGEVSHVIGESRLLTPEVEIVRRWKRRVDEGVDF